MVLDGLFGAPPAAPADAKGIYRGEMSWILENNAPMKNAMLNMGFRLYKRYRLYDLGL